MNDMRVVVGVEAVLLERHNHEETEKPKGKVRTEMRLALEVVSLTPKKPECVALEQKFDEWKRMALQTSQDERDRLIGYESVKVYALLHQENRPKKCTERAR